MKEVFQNNESEGQWLPISDLMSVLMMVFLLIAVSYMLKVFAEKEKIEEIAVTYNRLQNDLYEDLNTEFKADLEQWDAEIDQASLSVRFKSPEILFATGSDDLKPKFKLILNDFFPRFTSILHADKYRSEIEEIRIEGHTSSFWRKETNDHDAYINNMKLSQGRTRKVLEHVISLDDLKNKNSWLRSNVTANGLSSSKVILNPDSTENFNYSQRVEFRVKTNAEDKIAKILLAE